MNPKQTSWHSIQCVAVLYHPKIKATHPVAKALQAWLHDRSLDAWGGDTWDESLEPRIAEVDLVVVIGGDGSMLRAARMTAPYGVPIVGLNMGRLGFLSEMTPDNWQERLSRILSGEAWVEKRMMLNAQMWRGEEKLGEYQALNDIVISRGEMARVIRLHTEIDGEPMTTYSADGLIVSTPTGSTAYALAVGGPVLPPELRNILVVPIASHMSLDRAVVLSEGCLIRIHLSTDHQTILTVDGQQKFRMADKDHVDIQISEHSSRFLRLGSKTYFYQSLLARLTPNKDK